MYQSNQFQMQAFYCCLFSTYFLLLEINCLMVLSLGKHRILITKTKMIGITLSFLHKFIQLEQAGLQRCGIIQLIFQMDLSSIKKIGSHLSFVFYMAQTLICDYIFLSLIQIIIIEQFEKYYLPKDNTINIFKIDVEKFKLVWHHFSQEKFNCIKIKESQLVEFIKRLGD